MSTSTRNGTTHTLTADQQQAVEILVPHWQKAGSRDQAAMALSGGLLRARWIPELVREFIGAVAEQAGDEEAAKRMTVVDGSAEKLEKGERVTGWPSLIGQLGSNGSDIVRRLLEKLGITRPITLAELAEHKALPVKYLMSLGLHDMKGGGVGIPYRNGSGQPVVKKRSALEAKRGSYWPEKLPLQAYGEDRIEQAVTAGYQVVLEGESDCWALWYHDFPALGLPGAHTVDKTLALGHVGAVRKVYVVQEPDKSGEGFPAKVCKKLADLGWEGQVLVVTVDGFKDPSDLHKADPEKFRERFQKALDHAEPPLTVPAMAGLPEVQSYPWPDDLAPEAYHGLAGEVVKDLEPHSEADPGGLLAQFLVAFGNRIGRTVHWRIEGTDHFLNLFLVMVGRTSKSRKGTSWGRILQIMAQVEPDWSAERVKGGLASGEGMVYEVRDPVEGKQPIKGKGGRIEGYQDVVLDHGIDDKRLLCVEEEYAGVLRMLERQGNSLSQRIREAWQGNKLGSMTKTNKTTCKEPHISIIGHVTAEELRRYLTTTEMANGFGNRHLWLMVKRRKLLPRGSRYAPRPEHIARLKQAADFAVLVKDTVLELGEEAGAVWDAVYGALSEGRPGKAGNMLSRAEAQVMRLACLYAVLDLSQEIRADHLQAALALWDYCEASVLYIFGDSLGDPVADEILRALRHTQAGMTRTDISNLFGRNRSANEIGRALALLLQYGLAVKGSKKTAGASAEVWTAAGKRGGTK